MKGFRYSREKNARLTDGERRDNTLRLFEEESFAPAAMIKEGRAYSILTDHLGTPTEAYDADGNELWSRTLDMNGEVIEENGNIGMIPFLFQGQYYDRETGLAYNRFRYYSPRLPPPTLSVPGRINTLCHEHRAGHSCRTFAGRFRLPAMMFATGKSHLCSRINQAPPE